VCVCACVNCMSTSTENKNGIDLFLHYSLCEPVDVYFFVFFP